MLVEAVVTVLSVCHICLQQVFREGLASAERDGADRRPLIPVRWLGGEEGDGVG